MRVDVHNHVIPERALALLRRDARFGVVIEGTRWSGPNYSDFELTPGFTDPDAKLVELAGAELDGAALSVAPKPLFFYEVDRDASELLCRESNLGIAEFCQVDPVALRWMAHLPLRFPDLAVTLLEEAIDQGACGVIAGTSIAGRRLDEADYEPFWSAVEQAGLPVFLHPGYEEQHPATQDYYLHSVIGLPLEVTIAVERLVVSGTFDRHPGVTVIAALGGGFFPYGAGRLRQYTGFKPELVAVAPEDPWACVGQLKFDTVVYDREALRFLVAAAGPDNVLVGTDWPFQTGVVAPITDLRAVTDEATVRRIAEDNPAALFGFPAAPDD